MKQANGLFDPEGPVAGSWNLDRQRFFFLFSIMTARMSYLCDKPLISPLHEQINNV